MDTVPGARDADLAARTLKDLFQNGAAFPSFVALLEIGLGQRAQALDTLQEMAESRIGAGLHGLGQWHAFDQLSADPRYQRLLAQAPWGEFHYTH